MFHLILRTYITNSSTLFVVMSGTPSRDSTIDLFGALSDKIAHLPRRRMICARSSKLTPLSTRRYLETVSVEGDAGGSNTNLRHQLTDAAFHDVGGRIKRSESVHVSVSRYCDGCAH
jgi:hypothetical protein